MSDEVLISQNELEALYEEAEQSLEEATSFSQIGKFHYYNTLHIWDPENRWRECDVKTYQTHKVGFGVGMKHVQLHVCIDTQEFNPNLQFKYERRIQVAEKNWFRGKDDIIKSDWNGIWEPSVKSVLGTEYKKMTQALEYLEGKYVKCLDVLQQPTKRNPEPEYKTAKLIAVYESREAAYQDHQVITGNNEPLDETTTSESKPGPTADYKTWDEFAGNVRTMRKQGSSDKEIAEMLEVKIKDVLKVK